MDGDLQNMTQAFFDIGWFRLPVEENSKVIEVLNEILTVFALVSNPLLLWMIVKNPGKSTRKNSAILLANLCLVNLIVAGVGLGRLVDRHNGTAILRHKVGVIFMSIMLPKYYASILFLTLTYYGMIVSPLKFRALEPRNVRTMVVIAAFMWIESTAVFLIPPFFVDDFDNYVKTMVTVVVSLCWFITIVIVAMYAKILITLRHRTVALKKTFNMTSSQQGLVVIKQNTKLAVVLFLFILTLVVCTLPIYTGYLFILHCPQCNQHVITMFCLCMLPAFMSVPAFHAIHWLIGTPQYYKELKRLARQMLVFCRIVNEN